MRLIDADALEELFREVIFRLAKNPDISGDIEHMIRSSATVIEMIQDAPSIEMLSAQQWIPCSERLPEEDGLEVLFSSRFGRVHIGKYHDDASLNRWFSYRDKIRLMNDEVTAWTPLPEPYKGEDE